MKIINWLLSGAEKFNRVFINVGAIAVVAIMVVDTLSIVGLWFGKRVIPGDKTIIEEMMILVVYISLAYVLFERGHIKTEILKKRSSPPLHFASTVVALVVMMGVSIYIGWQNLFGGLECLRHNAVQTADLPIPTGPFFLVIAISFFNLALCALLFLIKECLAREVLRASTKKAT